MKVNLKKIMLAVSSCTSLLTLSCTSIHTSQVSEPEESQRFSDGGKILRIASWNEEIQNYMQNDLGHNVTNDGILPDDVKVEFVLCPSDEYQNYLDNLLYTNNTTAPNNRIDLFMAEPEYLYKYIERDLTLDLRKDLGITDNDIKNQFKFSVDAGTNTAGKLKSLAPIVYPSGFIYRRSIAKDLFGTDNPSIVQEKIKTWNDFKKTAQLAKEKGYYMVGAVDETLKAYTSTAEQDSQNTMDGIEKTYSEWASYAKDFLDNEYTPYQYQWTADWTNEMKAEGNVFGYFGPQWFIDFIMAPMSEMDYYNGYYSEFGTTETSSGDWALCQGPASFNWGGSWICAAAGTDNAKEAAAFIKAITCNTEIMRDYAKNENVFVNNRTVIKELSESNYANNFLGGQNYYKILLKCGESIKHISHDPMTKYLETMISELYEPYFSGYMTKKEADENMKQNLRDRFEH